MPPGEDLTLDLEQIKPRHIIAIRRPPATIWWVWR